MGFNHLKNRASYDRLIGKLDEQLSQSIIDSTKLVELIHKHEDEIPARQLELIKAQKSAMNMVQSILRLRISELKERRSKADV